MRTWLLGCAVILAGCASAKMEAPRITPAEAQRLIGADSTVVILDVRTKEEFNGTLGHLERALLIPVQSLEDRIGELEPFRSRTIIVYCRTGGRSARAGKLLKDRGFSILDMEGGITRWGAEHLPVVKETNP